MTMLAEDCHIIIVCDDALGGNRVQHVRGVDVRTFCAGIMAALFDGDLARHDFSLGFASAVDAMAAGRIRFGDAVGTVRGAWDDVNDIGRRVPRYTDVVQSYCEAVGGGVTADGLHQA